MRDVRCEANKILPPLPPITMAATKGKGERRKGNVKDTSSSTPITNN